ncbi:hypothetical protein NDU88_002141 [Pleurodeles waltl]|uniref:Uncharacterized protein n=1 Tax=Pleurodeles waltl TaxID=8319 RepID=A0AAV7WPT1_PLEWA|nr:hypothetical protein NDU88_002141 [Pleurodeles waltl]
MQLRHQMPDARRVRRGRESLAVRSAEYLPAGVLVLSSVDPAGKRSDQCTAPAGAPEIVHTSGEPDCSCSKRHTPPAGGPKESGLSCGFPCGPLPKQPVRVRLVGE